jgi:hypothetical protein
MQAYYNNGLTPQATNPKGFLWWRECLSLFEANKDITNCTVKYGKPIQLWKYRCEESIIEDDMPHLFSFVKDENISIEMS